MIINYLNLQYHRIINKAQINVLIKRQIRIAISKKQL